MRHWTKLAICFAFTLFAVLVCEDLLAQCPMCKMSAESNMRAGGTDGQGLNAGILFMLSLPYVIIGSIGYTWWKRNRDSIGEEFTPFEAK